MIVVAKRFYSRIWSGSAIDPYMGGHVEATRRNPYAMIHVDRSSLSISVRFLQLLFYAALFVKSMASIGQAQTLAETYEKIDALEKLADKDSSNRDSALLKAMKLCDERDGKNSLMGEDYLVVAKFLHLRAFVTQEVADRVWKTKEPIRNTALKAYLQFVEYFDWLRERPAAELTDIMTKLGGPKDSQIFSASSGLGSAALSAHSAGGDEDYNACLVYELLDTDWLNPDALNQWLANLVYPNFSNPVNDTLFISLKDDDIKAKMQTAKWVDCWNKFRCALQQDKLQARDFYKKRATIYNAFSKRICTLLGSSCDENCSSASP
jgi:hypothetical protein